MARRPSIVVFGLLSKLPVAGIVWLTVPYLVGLRRLGYDVYYVEAHGRTPSMLMRSAQDDSARLAAEFIESVMRRFGFEHNWAYEALHDDGRVFGLPEEKLRSLYRSADLLVNLHGGTEPTSEHTATGRLVLIETDPVELEAELAAGDARAWDYVRAHAALFTWGENFGAPDCSVPIPDGVRFVPTRAPVLLDEWRTNRPPTRLAFTTIGNWRQPWRDVEIGGEVYGWSKHSEFLKVLDLPARVGPRFELCLASTTPEDLSLLERHGWAVSAADAISGDIDAYRRFVQSSLGEFTVAKDQNVRLRSGWFSDRAASYLASGRPVITQDTGFSNVLPVGEGLFGFATTDDAAVAVLEVLSDYKRHSRAAAEIAAEYFDAEKVLRAILGEVGLPVFPPSLSLAVSRHPTELSLEARQELMPISLPGRRRRVSPTAEVSVVVVTSDGAPFTRLCLETLLADGSAPPLELIAVDNASTDGTVEYLGALASRDPRVVLQRNLRNEGFAVACNQGLAEARSQVLVLLNNDTVVPPGALRRLVACLDDPAVGMAAPVTNRSGGERELEVDYADLAGLYATAARRADEQRGVTTEAAMLTMFCVALRRETFARIGPLDERFEVGLFEDDDYSLRVRDAGYRLVHAEDALVHHFGQASLGRLVPSGEFARLFERNRVRFEEKWERTWPARGRNGNDDYRELVRRVREVVLETVPAGARILVLSHGDDDLLEFEERQAGHFPQDGDGVYAGFYPADDAEALSQLDRLDAEFLVVPRPSFWWLDYYGALRDRLEDRCLVAEADCSIFALKGAR